MTGAAAPRPSAPDTAGMTTRDPQAPTRQRLAGLQMAFSALALALMALVVCLLAQAGPPPAGSAAQEVSARA